MKKKVKHRQVRVPKPKKAGKDTMRIASRSDGMGRTGGSRYTLRMAY